MPLWKHYAASSPTGRRLRYFLDPHSDLPLPPSPIRCVGMSQPRQPMTVAGLFAGVGGIELGFHRAGHETALLCEVDEGARRVLSMRFPGVPTIPDVRSIKTLPPVNVIAAGFPCQDLSQAGRTAGIRGKQSGLIGHVFRLIDERARAPRWLLLENVPFMLQLERGRAMRYLVDALEERNFAWAYRVVDARAFGLPQRRQRVLLVASRTEDPRNVLFADDATPTENQFSPDSWCGFYWTEGLRGLGWAVDAVPTLKGGSTIGIPSPPGIWDPRRGTIRVPEIRDVERLQGFDPDWTLPALADKSVRPGHRWKLIGNAVSVPVAEWVAGRLGDPGKFDPNQFSKVLPRGVAWPKAAWGHKGKVFAVDCSLWPVKRPAQPLSRFLQYPLSDLSLRAAQGFLSRALVGGLRFQDGFLDDVRGHIARSPRTSAA